MSNSGERRGSRAPFTASSAGETSRYERYLKRPIDVVGASLGLVLSAPIMLLTAASIRFTMGKPVLFRQVRPGRNEELFTLLKFRTMREPKPGADDSLETDDQRLTKVGLILRKTSIDELPQMFNILKGDMSFIGPRPLLVQYLDYYTEPERRRHRVRPGITGLAQVNGRSSLGWAEIFAYDLEYVNSLSAALDARIALRTISVVLKRKDIIDSGAEWEPPLHVHRTSAPALRAT